MIHFVFQFIMEKLMKPNHRTLSPAQSNALLHKPASHNPLWLTLACRLLSSDLLKEGDLSNQIEDLPQDLVE